MSERSEVKSRRGSPKHGSSLTYDANALNHRNHHRNLSLGLVLPTLRNFARLEPSSEFRFCWRERSNSTRMVTRSRCHCALSCNLVRSLLQDLSKKRIRGRCLGPHTARQGSSVLSHFVRSCIIRSRTGSFKLVLGHYERNRKEYHSSAGFRQLTPKERQAPHHFRFGLAVRLIPSSCINCHGSVCMGVRAGNKASSEVNGNESALVIANKG